MKNWKKTNPEISVENLKEYLMGIFTPRERPIVFRCQKEYALTMAHLVNDKKLIDLITSLPNDTAWVEVTIK